MKKTIKYKGIKEIVYVLHEYELRDIAIDHIEKSKLYTKPQDKFTYSYEMFEGDNGKFLMEVTQTIIEKEKEETD